MGSTRQGAPKADSLKVRYGGEADIAWAGSGRAKLTLEPSHIDARFLPLGRGRERAGVEKRQHVW